MAKVTVGGDRLGAGKKEKVELRNFNRSTHDLSYVWRSSMASGTLVPFMKQLALPGDSFDITLRGDGKTLPTIGPLFGSYKIQYDVFLCPIELYQVDLKMNLNEVGLRMNNVKLPFVSLRGNSPNGDEEDLDNCQINPSNIWSYLGMRGLGHLTDDYITTESTRIVKREVNAVPYLAYADIYKNYYANKQEEVGMVIHNDLIEINATISNALLSQIDIYTGSDTTHTLIENDETNNLLYIWGSGHSGKLTIDFGFIEEIFETDVIQIWIEEEWKSISQVFKQIKWVSATKLVCNNIQDYYKEIQLVVIGGYRIKRNEENIYKLEPNIVSFPLENIDKMRRALYKADEGIPFDVNDAKLTPYSYSLQWEAEIEEGINIIGRSSLLSPQEGLFLKTYQSDKFNNWISTEWIDGNDGINQLTAIDVTGDVITINEINVAQKVYKMLNNIAISGGSVDDWQEAVYNHKSYGSINSPMYMGGLSKELVFQEVISNAEAEGQPLGTLAGRGMMSEKNKGGNITIKVDKPSYIMGIVSITPRIDYSQGNDWDNNLQTMDDLHKPDLDGIGFQDLITDQMHWADTDCFDGNAPAFKSAGKQPAWINYMTNTNVVKGNFADQRKEMFMTLNRRYEYDTINKKISDLTTYIDPSKFNHIFADTRRDAQNFWMQIGVDITARRVMSAKIMPNT